MEKFLPVAVGGVPKLFIGKLKPPEFVGPEAEGQGTFGRENPIDLEASLLYRAAKSMGRRNKFDLIHKLATRWHTTSKNVFCLHF